jgi:hypothetical protein
MGLTLLETIIRVERDEASAVQVFATREARRISAA